MDEPTREELMLRQVWSNVFGCLGPLEEAFVIDQSLPAQVAEQIAGAADVAATLDCWRDKMVAAIDEVVRRFKGE